MDSKKILDFGCGEGMPSFALIYAGARDVIGVDISIERIRQAKSNAKFLKQDNSYSVEFLQLNDTTHLPFQNEEFDICICNAVLEHIPKNDRKNHIKEIFRIIKKGGLVFINGTPNRIFPKDSHLTNLWFIHWLPFTLAKRYALLRGRIKTTNGIEQRGLDGCSYWEITGALRNELFIVLNRNDKSEIDLYFSLSLMKTTIKIKRYFKKLVKSLYIVINLIICRPLHIQIAALLPFLTICIKKLGESK